MNKVVNAVLVVTSLVLLGGTCYKVADSNVNVVGNTNSVSNMNSEVNTNSSPTADWQTYTNEEYGLSFRYPEGWKSVDLTSEQPSQGYILFLGLGPKEVKEDYLFGIRLINSTVEQEIENAQKVSSNSKVLEVTGIFIEGVLGTRVLTQNNTNQLKGEEVIFEHNGLVYVISGSIDEGPFEQFLDSFIFSRPGWTTYSNQDLGLRFMYPKEWSLTHAESGTDFVDRLDNINIFEHQLVNIDIRWSSRHEDIVSESGLVDKSLDHWLDCSNTYEEQVSCGSVVIDGVDMIKREGKIQTSFGDSYVALAFKQDDFTVSIDARSLLQEVSSGEPGNDNLDGLEYIEKLIETIRME